MCASPHTKIIQKQLDGVGTPQVEAGTPLVKQFTINARKYYSEAFLIYLPCYIIYFFYEFYKLDYLFIHWKDINTDHSIACLKTWLHLFTCWNTPS